MIRRMGVAVVASAVLALAVSTAEAGSIFLTGHDPDFHALLGGNAVGAQKINQVAIDFVTDGTFNPFTTGTSKFLYVESLISPPGGHIDGIGGLTASGYVNGVDFERHGAGTLLAELGLLGTKYNAIVVASDFGALLTQAELDILNANSGLIISFLNAGGGLYAMAEGNGGAHLTPAGGHYGYLPFIVSSTSLDQGESGFTVTPFGMSLGLTAADVNGNASHNIFTSTGGMDVVDRDSLGSIMSLAVRAQITTAGVVPLPSAAWAGLSLLCLLGIAGRRRLRASS